MKILSNQEKSRLWRVTLMTGIISGFVYLMIFLFSGDIPGTKEIILTNFFPYKIDLPFYLSRIWDILAIPFIFFIAILFYKIISVNDDYANEKKKNNVGFLISIFIFSSYLLFSCYVFKLGLAFAISLVMTMITSPITISLDVKNGTLFLMFLPWMLLIISIGIIDSFVIAAFVTLACFITLLLAVLIKKIILKIMEKKLVNNFFNWLNGK